MFVVAFFVPSKHNPYSSYRQSQRFEDYAFTFGFTEKLLKGNMAGDHFYAVNQISQLLGRKSNMKKSLKQKRTEIAERWSFKL